VEKWKASEAPTGRQQTVQTMEKISLYIGLLLQIAVFGQWKSGKH
jgi:hypothetical protein